MRPHQRALFLVPVLALATATHAAPDQGGAPRGASAAARGDQPGPSGAVQGGGRFTATGTRTPRSHEERAAEVVNVRDFGARADGSDDTAAIQAAIDHAVSSGKRVVHLPAGTYALSGSLNLQGIWGLTITGAGVGWYNTTKLVGSRPGRPVVDAVGANFLTMRDLEIYGSGPADPPQAGIVLSRNASNTNAGMHEFHHVYVRGYYSVAAVVSLSSEVNRWVNCVIDNGAPGGVGFWTESGNVMGVSSDWTPAPAVQSGGNTMFQFVSTNFGAWGDARAVAVKGTFTNASWSGCYSRSTGRAAFELTGGISNSIISGHRDESRSTYGVLFGGQVLNLSIIGSHFGRGLYGLDDVTVSRLTMLSSEVYWAGQPDPPGPYVLNVATLKYSTIDAQNNIKVRKGAYANQFTGIGEGMLGGAVLSLPPDARGNTWVRERALPGYPGPPVYEWHVADGDPRSHLVTQRIQASKFVDVVQRLRSSAQPVPGTVDPVDSSKGSVISVLLDRDTVIRNPRYGPLEGGSDDGARLTFLLTQDATGGRTVTWPLPSLQAPAQFKVDPAPNAVTVIHFLADPTTGRWQATGWSLPPPSRQTLTLDVPRLAPTSCGADQTIGFKGAVAGAECAVGLPVSPAAGLMVSCYVSEADSVRLRFCNPTSEAIAPASATYSVRVFNP